MRHLFLPLLLLGCLGGSACGEASQPAEAADSARQAEPNAAPAVAPAPTGPQQLLVVLTANWDAVPGTLLYYERQGADWRLAGESIPVVVGKKGLGWGRGIADYTGQPGPVKQEGDLKSPAGVFTLGEAFGYAPPAAATFVKAPYTHVTARTMCIEDVASAHYNRILDEGEVAADWNSTDHMLRQDDLYEWGMFVAHNSSPAQPGGGSCIFLHVWRQADSGTAGCTAMPKSRMRDLLAWIDPAAQPLLIQVPVGAYAPFQAQYGLPPLP